MNRRRCLIAALTGLALAQSASARVLTYTDNGAASDEYALGYPVPTPVDSTTPVDGFRSYDSLNARHQALALSNPAISASSVGQTTEGRIVWAYTLSDADTTTPRGDREAATLINGTIHAREWASPEVVTALIERLDAISTDGGVGQYVIENTNVVIVPVLNVDGFIHTQRTPAQVLESTFSGDPSSRYPRDGRMRRKNMRGVDDVLATESDGLGGIDLNRNSNPFWATSAQSSGDVRSLVFHGNAPASEPEIQALQQAADLGPADRLRFYVDAHAFSRVFFGSNTGNSRLDRNARNLIAAVGRSTSGYGYDPGPAGLGIGVTQEYFTETYQIPGYTLEIEPGPGGATEYGGFGASHDGFILPEAEVGRVRDELSKALLLGIYRQAGPPAVLAASIRDISSNALVYDARWSNTNGGQRTLQINARSGLVAGRSYRASLAFDKPMRVRNASAQLAQFQGQNVTLAPTLSLEGVDADGAAFRQSLSAAASGWRASDPERYADDRYEFDFVPSASRRLDTVQRLALTVAVRDLSGLALDANPATPVDWRNGGWAGYEDDNGSASTDAGGVDRSLRIVDDGAPLFTAAPGPGADDQGGSSGALGAPLLAGWMALLLLGTLWPSLHSNRIT